MTNARLFKLMRDTDVTGVSGAGHVADGVLFGDGTIAMRWRSEHRSTAVYASMDDLIAIHGHDGATRVEFCDERERRAEVIISALEEVYGPDWNDKVAFIREPKQMREWMRATDFKNAVAQIVGEEMDRRSHAQEREFARMMRDEQQRQRSTVTQLRRTH